jgi:hypothetical protein
VMFWAIMLCNLVGRYQHFRGSRFLPNVEICLQKLQCHNPENHNIDKHNSGNLKTYISVQIVQELSLQRGKKLDVFPVNISVICTLL